MTAPVGRDAFLTCVVQDLGPYKVSLGDVGSANPLITELKLANQLGSASAIHIVQIYPNILFAASRGLNYTLNKQPQNRNRPH